MKRILFLVFLAATQQLVLSQNATKPFVSPVFSDNMVLQRDREDSIWGWAKPGEEVTAAIAGRTAKAVAGANGKWLAKLTPPPAGGPYELTVTGSQKLTFKNVLVGDVWICSGQSNMEFGMKKIVNAEEEIAQANHPEIRLFTLGKTTALHPIDTLKGNWLPCTPETVKVGVWDGFSAVAYFFGRELQRNLKVPIGLIQTGWGATAAEAWTSGEALAKIGPDFDSALAGLAQVSPMIETGTYNRQKLLDDWFGQNGVSPVVATPGFDASSWKTMHKLPHLWGANDNPALADFLGAVWFRKEIDLPAEVAGKEAELHFGCLDDGDVTFVNGMKVGDTMTLAPRKYKVPAGLLKPGRNVIATWVLNTAGGGGMAGKPEELSLNVAGFSPLSLAGDWQYQVRARLDQMPPRLFAINNNAGWPTELFNAMIFPLTRFGIKGAIWYQGEANVGRAHQYRRLLPAMISGWRIAWQQGDFPFLIVQLANFGPSAGARPAESAMAELREAQALAARSLPNVGLVTAVDIGEPGDIHPKNKQEVGRRLGVVARAQVYHQAIPFSGPVYKSSNPRGGTLRIAFDHAERLHAKDESSLKGFAVAGEDHVFHWADARIEANEVVLTSPEMTHPVAARYDWDASPKGNLYNQAGLPAFPFRTDDWPGVTANNK